MRSIRPLLVAISLFVAVYEPREARAHGGVASIGDRREFILAGPEFGYAVSEESEGVLVGAEASWVVWQDLGWWGLLAQARYDDAHRAGYLAFGPEAGALFFGVDASAIALIGEESAIGARGRMCVTLAVVGSCAGGAATTAGVFAEFSTTIKFPYELDD